MFGGGGGRVKGRLNKGEELVNPLSMVITCGISENRKIGIAGREMEYTRTIIACHLSCYSLHVY